MEPVYIRTLGAFSLRYGNNQISDNDNRTRKLWLLLSYLLCHRGQVVSQKRLISLLWGEDPASSNPENALRITFHRVRTLLDGLWPGAGKELILYRDGGYIWNENTAVEVDCDRFEALCQTAADSPSQRLALLLEAIALYKGPFLEKQSTETWIIPISTHYHNRYIQAVIEATGLLQEEKRYSEGAAICRAAVTQEPYHEQLHQLLMEMLVGCGDIRGAERVYEDLRTRLFDDFGIHPSAETRKVYRELIHSPNQAQLPLDEVLEHLQEPVFSAGAMQCDYDHFKVLCHAQSRDMERSGNVTHVVLISVASATEKPLSKAALSRTMDRLGEQVRLNLRRGDTFSRCSLSQYILMLPKANYENSCMVSRRLINAFQRAHPHMQVKLHYMVQPLTVKINIP